MPTTLVVPAREHLATYEEALLRGYSPSSTRPALREEELAALRADPARFLAVQDDPEARGEPVTMPDRSQIPRLPSITRWIWDKGFCGSIALRWQHGTTALPSHALAHVGYSVAPWRRREGHATRALRLMLEEAHHRGLPFAEITTTPDNIPSQRVIEANGGILVDRFEKPSVNGRGEALRYRVRTSPAA